MSKHNLFQNYINELVDIQTKVAKEDGSIQVLA